MALFLKLFFFNSIIQASETQMKNEFHLVGKIGILIQGTDHQIGLKPSNGCWVCWSWQPDDN